MKNVSQVEEVFLAYCISDQESYLAAVKKDLWEAAKQVGAGDCSIKTDPVSTKTYPNDFVVTFIDRTAEDAEGSDSKTYDVVFNLNRKPTPAMAQGAFRVVYFPKDNWITVKRIPHWKVRFPALEASDNERFPLSVPVARH